jgi:hypothetical protein
VTDSLLSSNGGPPAKGQKLFQVDDHTICTIAGWYSASGPTIDGVNFPAYTAVSTILRWFLSRSQNIPHLSLDEKLKNISSTFKFGLEAMAEIENTTGEPASDQPSEISLAGVDGGKLKIVHLELMPRIQGNRVSYEPQHFSEKEVSQNFIYLVAGWPDVAEPFLEHPEKYRELDPILQEYADAKAKDGGASLSLDDMTMIAKVLEQKTAARHPNEVGGLRQIAIVRDAKVEIVQQPIEQAGDPPAIPSLLTKIERPTMGGTKYGITIGVPNTAFVIDGDFSNIKMQTLDNIFFYRTKFDHVVLYYEGTPKFIFDKSNTVTDSKLMLAPGVDSHSKAVTTIRSDFPDLPIVDSAEKPIE